MLHILEYNISIISFSKSNMHNPESGPSNEYNLAWYNKAKIKAESIITHIDPNLEVAIVKDDSESGLALHFSLKNKPEVGFGISVGFVSEKGDEYINNELEGMIREMYRTIPKEDRHIQE